MARLTEIARRRERIRAGLANARRKGKRPGRKESLTSELFEEGKHLRAAGRSWREIGRELGLDEGTLRNRMKKSAATAR